MPKAGLQKSLKVGPGHSTWRGSTSPVGLVMWYHRSKQILHVGSYPKTVCQKVLSESFRADNSTILLIPWPNPSLPRLCKVAIIVV